MTKGEFLSDGNLCDWWFSDFPAGLDKDCHLEVWERVNCLLCLWVFIWLRKLVASLALRYFRYFITIPYGDASARRHPPLTNAIDESA